MRCAERERGQASENQAVRVKRGEREKEEKGKLLEGEQAGSGSVTSEAAALRRAA